MQFIEELRSLKEQLRFGETFEIPKGTENVVIAGMGGSGIAGKIFSELYTKMPIYLVDDYSAPEFINKKTLFIAQSYSGNTEETLSSIAEAKKKGAHTVVIASGGKLIDLGDQKVTVPKGLQPRSAPVSA